MKSKNIINIFGFVTLLVAISQSCSNAYDDSINDLSVTLESDLNDISLPRLKSGSESGGSNYAYNYSVTTMLSDSVKRISHRYTRTDTGNVTWKLLNFNGTEKCSADEYWTVHVPLIEDSYYVLSSSWTCVYFIKYIDASGAVHSSPTLSCCFVDTYVNNTTPYIYNYGNVQFTVIMSDKQAQIKCSAAGLHPLFSCSGGTISPPEDFYITQ
jgi:hypothetical protein